DSCNACHSQLIRPFKSETDRYGMYSVSGEFAYDRPFLWGSKRTGPDLARVGNYRTADWHENHMWDPTSVVPDSIMPSYKHMFKNNADIETAYAEALTVKKVFNVPYDTENGTKLGSWEDAQAEVKAEAQAIVDQMKNQEVKDAFAKGEIKEIVALIAYLNSLK
ncbi:cytochrome-c oxidase, cbb3-type subunit II, partial [Campylobacter jejuni]